MRRRSTGDDQQISPAGQARDDALPVAVAVAVEAAPVHLRPIGPDAGCAVLTLAVLAVAVRDPAPPGRGPHLPSPRSGRLGWRAGVPLGVGRDAPWRRHASTRSPASGCSRWPPRPSRRAGHPAVWPDRPPPAAAATLRWPAGPPRDADGRGRRSAAATARSNGPGAARRCGSEPPTVPPAGSPPSSSCWPWRPSVSGGHRRGRAHGARRRSRGAARRVPARRGTRGRDRAGRGPPRAAALGAFLDGPRSAEARPGSTPSCCAGPAP